MNKKAITIDQEAFRQTCLACEDVVSKRSDQLEERRYMLLLRLLYRECRLYFLLAIVFSTILYQLLKYIEPNEIYLLIYIQVGVLGILSFIELVKEYRYGVEELQYPTRIGGTRILIYKLIILSTTQIVCILGIGFSSMYLYQLNILNVLWISILPCMFINGIAMQSAVRYTSLKAAITGYFVAYVLYYVIYLILFQYFTIQTLSIMFIFGSSILYYLWCCAQFHKVIHNEGGYLQWN